MKKCLLFLLLSGFGLTQTQITRTHEEDEIISYERFKYKYRYPLQLDNIYFIDDMISDFSKLSEQDKSHAKKWLFILLKRSGHELKDPNEVLEHLYKIRLNLFNLEY